MGWKSGLSIGFLLEGFYRGHKRGMFLTNSSQRKAKREPLPQPVVSALRILFLVSNNVLQKEKKTNFKGNGPFLSVGEKKCLLNIKAQALGNTIFILLLLFPLQDNQALVENCTMRDIIKPAYICKEHWEHQFVCWVKEGVLSHSWDRGTSKDTEGKVRNENRTHRSHSPGSAQAAHLSPCTLPDAFVLTWARSD